MSNQRNAGPATPPTWRATARRSGRVIALLVVLSQSLLLISNATPLKVEIGTNDFRISDMCPNGYPWARAYNPAIAYNSMNQEYLVVWQGDDVYEDRVEIFGQRLDATDGSELGTNDLRISNIGTEGSRWFGAVNPAVTYNSIGHEYLVVWQGDSLDLTNSNFEIYGQRLHATTAAEVGSNDFRISDMGSVDGDHDYDAESASVVHNERDNEYLIVWSGDDDTSPLANNEFEIYGQRLSGSACAEVGDNDFRISDMGDTDGDPSFEAHDPAVAYGHGVDEYLVVWQGSEHLTSPSVIEFEIFGQRIMLPTLTFYAWD